MIVQYFVVKTQQDDMIENVSIVHVHYRWRLRWQWWWWGGGGLVGGGRDMESSAFENL